MRRLLVAFVLLWAVSASAQSVTVAGSNSPPPITLQSAVTANANGTAIVTTGYAQVLLDVLCTTCSGGTLVNFEASADNSVWFSVYAYQFGTAATIAASTTATSVWQVHTGASIRSVRARISAYSAGTVTVKGYLGVLSAGPVGYNVNVIGTVPVSGTFWQATQPVSGTFWQATQPVSIATLPALAAGSAVIGHVIVDTTSTTAVTQATGTNLHAVLDTTSTTAVTQATAANLNAAVVGTGTAGTAAGGVLTIQGVAAMTKLLVTPDSVALPANQSVNVAQIAGTTTVTAGVAGTQGVGGCVATNVAITCNPNLMAAQAVSSENSAATTARAVQLVADLVGKLIVMPYANPENNLDGTITSAMTGTTSTVFSGMGAQGGSLRVYVTACTLSNAHATVGTDVVLQDGSGGTTLWTLPAAPAYGGSHAVFPNALKTTANNALYAANVTTGASTKISCTGYKGL